MPHRTTVAFDPAPDRLSAGEAQFDLRLRRRERWRLVVEATPSLGDERARRRTRTTARSTRRPCSWSRSRSTSASPATSTSRARTASRSGLDVDALERRVRVAPLPVAGLTRLEWTGVPAGRERIDVSVRVRGGEASADVTLPAGWTRDGG